MNERELSRLAVLSEALVRRPSDYVELVEIMREGNRLDINSPLAKAVQIIEDAFRRKGFERVSDPEVCSGLLNELIVELECGPIQVQVSRMLAWAKSING